MSKSKSDHNDWWPGRIWLIGETYVKERVPSNHHDAVEYVRGDEHAELLSWFEERPCEWSPEESTGSWTSSCGELWQFTDGDPEENRVRYCHGCGQRVRIVVEE